MADRYWVGGTGTWSSTSTTNWSTSSGGASGASVPTAADNVIFDANSNVGTGAFTVTMANTPRVCNDFTASGLDGSMILAGTSIGLTVSGSLSFPATNFTRTYTGTTTFNATATGKTITTNGVAFGGAVTLNGVGGAWTLGSAFSCGTSTLTLTNGTFDTSVSNYAVTAGAFSSSNSNTRTINLNNSTITISSATAWSMFTSTNATLNAGNSTISLSNTSNPTFDGGGLTYYNLSFTATSISGLARAIRGTNTFNNLTFSAPAFVGVNSISLSGNQTINGTLTVTGVNSTQRMFIRSNITGTSVILTCAAIASTTDVDFRDITIAGAHGTLSGTRLGDCNGNSNITFDAGKTVYWNLAAGGNWSATAWALSSGGAVAAANFPLAQDTVIIENTGLNTSATISINETYNMGTLDTSTRTNAMTLASGGRTPTFYGNFTYGSGVTPTGTGTYTFSNRSTKTLNSGGKTFTQPVALEAPGGGIQLVTNNLTLGSTLQTTLSQGTLDLNNLTLTTGLFDSNATDTRTIAFGTGNITCSGTGTVWNTATVTGLTTTGTQVVNVTSSGSTAITVTPGVALEANSISYNFTGGTYALTFLASSSNTARNVNFTGYAGTWQATAAATIYGNLTLSTGMSLTSFSNTLTFRATSGIQQITSNGKTFDIPITFNGVGGTFQLQDALTMGSTRTATLTNGTLDLQSYTLSTGLFSSSNSNTRTIAFGTGNITCTGTGTVWNTATTTELTTTGTQVVNVTSVGSTAITVSTGALSEANSISYNFTGGTYALTFLGSSSHTARNVDFTGYAGTWQATSSVTVYGNLTLSTGMLLTASISSMLFGATSGTKTITSNGKTMDFQINFNAPSATYVLQDAITVGSTRNTTFTAGTVNFAGFTLTTGTASSQGNSTRNITFNGGSLIIVGSGATAWNVTGGSGFTTTAGTGTGTISMTAATAKTFVGGGFTYNCTLNQGGAGALTITGSNTFSDITNTVQPASVLFTAGTTNTFSNFSLSGTAGNLITIGSVTAASHTLSKASGTVSVSFCSISQSNGTGGATWEALTTNGNVDGGNNTGWIFSAVAPSTGNFLMFF